MERNSFFGNTAADVIERIKYVYGMSTSKELAQKFHLSESGLSSAIKRNSIPYELCKNVALSNGIPMDWILFGDVDGDLHYRAMSAEYLDRAYLHADFEEDPELFKALQKSEQLDSDKAMLLAGWDFLNHQQRDCVFQLVRQLARGDEVTLTISQSSHQVD